jgi:hypothetical protein
VLGGRYTVELMVLEGMEEPNESNETRKFSAIAHGMKAIFQP